MNIFLNFRAFSLWVLFYVFGIFVGKQLSNCDFVWCGILLIVGILFEGALLFTKKQGLALLTLAFGIGFATQMTTDPLWKETKQISNLFQRVGIEKASKEPPCYEGLVLDVYPSGMQNMTARIQVEQVGIRVSSLERGEQVQRSFYQTSFQALLTVIGNKELLPGDLILACLHLHEPQSFLDPGSFSFYLWTKHQKVQAVGRIRSESLVRFSQKQSFFVHPWLMLKRYLALFREDANKKLTQALSEKPVEKALLASLILGDRSSLEATQEIRKAQEKKSLEQAFRDAGIYHVLSVSGFHVTVVTYLFYVVITALFLRFPRWPLSIPAKRVGALFSILVTILYTLLTGAEVATIRAAAMAIFGFLAIFFGYRALMSERIAFAVLVILHPGATPNALFDPSFQLSLGALLGLLYIRPIKRTKEAFQQRGFFLNAKWMERVPRNLFFQFIRKGFQKITQGVDATLGALLPTIPLCAFYFSQFQAAGILGNLLALPLGELWVLPIGCLGLFMAYLFAPISEGLGFLMLQVAGWGATFFMKVTDVISMLPLSFYIPTPSFWMMILWFLGLILFFYQNRFGKWLCCAVFCSYCLLWFWPTSSLQASFLDIGQGDASVLTLPQGQVVMIDGGPHQGQQTLLPFLRSQGYQKIDLMIVSHPHPDHVIGLIQVLEEMPVLEIWTAENLLFQHPSSNRLPSHPSWDTFLQVVKKKKIPIHAPQKRIFGTVEIHPIGPCRMDSQEHDCQIEANPQQDANDNSIVIRVTYAGKSILFPGDIEKKGEQQLLDRVEQGISLQADVLKAPHHCSKTSSSWEFIQAVSPTYVMCSVGKENRYGFPHQEVIHRYQKQAVSIIRTDEKGRILLTISEDGKMKIDFYQSQND